MKNEVEKNNSGIASVILGMLSTLLFFVAPVAVILGLSGLIFSIVQMKTNKNKWAGWGMALSIIGLVLSLLVLYVMILIGAKMAGMYQLVSQCKLNPDLPQCADLLQALAPNLQSQIAAGAA